MKKFAGYLLDEQIYQGKRVEIWRGHPQGAHNSVIMKLPTDEFPSQADISRIKHEYDLLQKLDIEGIIHPVDFVTFGRSCGMALEDHGEHLLSDSVQNQPMDLEKFLNIAIQLTKILSELHENGIIHKDIKLENILINLLTGTVRLIDFSIASEISREYQEFTHPDLLEGTLAYISPEQTGRINRNIDYRTDFYSLGISFYKMLTGTMPFQTDSAIEMVHSHIAKVPVAPDQVVKSIPPILSKIVMKLIAKNSEDRYQSTRTLLHDLTRCLNELQKKGEIADFDIALHDIPSIFSVSQKLYGREQEIKTLLSTFEEIAQGKAKLFLVKGQSGVGKTSILNEIHQPISERKGFFIRGKFDQFKRDIAYGALSSALQDLAQQLLHLPEKELKEWRSTLISAVGKNGKILLDLAPDFEKIIGVQPELDELPSQQALNRFYYTLHEFFRVSATVHHPLVIFIDDLQWADISSLDLIKELMQSELTHYLLILGAYRSNEVAAGHPLQNMIEKLSLKKSVIELNLLPLEQRSITDLLADTLYYNKSNLKLLSQYIFQKTEGNPFYTNVLLNTLYRDRLIYFNFQEGRWAWDLAKIQAKKVSENVVEYLLDRLRQLPEETQHVIQLAACIGNSFDLQTLSIINNYSSMQTAQLLESAIYKGLVIPLSNDYRIATAMTDLNVDSNITVLYQFAHDRVQQAAYQLLNEQERQAVHLAIARLLVKRSKDEDESKKNVIDLVHHFNLGAALLTGKEKVMVAELNYQAAVRAKKSSAFQASIQYCTYSKNLLGASCWKNHYNLAFHIYTLYGESAYLLAHYDEAEEACKLLLEHAKTSLEKVEVMYMQTLHYIAMNDYKNAFMLSINALNLLDIKISPYPSVWSVTRHFLSSLIRLSKIEPAKLIDKPFTTDKKSLFAVDLFYPAITSAYFTNNTFFQGVTVDVFLRYFLENPINQKSPKYCMIIFVMVAQTLHKYDMAHEWYKLAMAILSEHFNADTYLPIAIGYVTFLLLLFEHEHAAYPILEKGLNITLESGNKYFVPMYYALLFLTKPGVTATEICKLAEEHYNTVKEMGINDMLDMYLLRYAYYFNITGQTPGTESITYSCFDEENFIKEAAVEKYHVIPYIYYLVKMRLAYLYYDYEAAYKHLMQAFRYKGNEMVIFNLRELYLYSFLIHVRLWKKFSMAQKIKAKNRMRVAYRWIKRWADYCPMNFLHLQLLMDAELARLQNKPFEATLYFDRAIKSARENNYPERETFIREQAGLFYLQCGLQQYANFELNMALMGYQQQGASRKTTHLVEWHADILKNEMQAATLITDGTKLSISESVSDTASEEMLDIETILKTSKTILGEIELPKLLEKMLKILLENAGAQEGVLLLKTGNEWRVQAQGTPVHVEVLQNIALDEIDTKKIHLSKAIVDYVVRQGSMLVLANASQQGDFRNDPYIVENQCRSILCLPLINQGVLRGLLYLENNIAADVFALKQQRILLTLSTQAAIAIENTNLYEQLITLNRSYERFVPKEFLSFLEKDSIVDVGLGNQVQKEMTVMFSDIRNFTHFTEQLTPQESINFLNQFLSYMEPVIHEYNGFIDKYIGDAIMALFPNADDAVLCSTRMLEQLELFNINYPKAIRIGIGLNTGPLMLGIVGGKNRLQSTVISDAVNIASRVEDLNKEYTTEFLVSGSTIMALKNRWRYHFRRLSSTKLRGKESIIQVYEMFDHNKVELKKHKFESQELFESAVDYFDKGHYQEAQVIFAKIVAANPNDVVAKIYYDRCLAKKNLVQ